MKRCPKCNSLMPPDEHRCIRCGLDTSRKRRPILAPGKGGKIRNGWTLARQSWQALRLDKQLVVFPLASGIACLLVLASFVAGIWGSGAAQRADALGETTTWAILFAWYFASYFVIVFFNSALVFCALLRFRGATPTIGDGMRAARERIGLIAGWALFAATVGVALRFIESRSELVGRIVTLLLGAAWTVGTFFIVPVLVVEKLGPFEAFKRSVAIVRKAWGESLVSNLGIGLVTFLATLVLVIPAGVLVALLAVKMSSLTVALVGAALIVLVIFGISLVGSALHSIALAALYLYANGEKVPETFEPGLLGARS